MPPLSRHLAVCQKWSLWNMESRCFIVHVQMRPQKWHLAALSQWDKHTSGNSWAGFNIKAQRPHAAFSCIDRVHRPAAFQNGCCPLWLHTRSLGSVSHDPTKSQRQRLASPPEPKLPQHEYDNHAVFFMYRRKAISSCPDLWHHLLASSFKPTSFKFPAFLPESPCRVRTWKSL